MKKLMVAAAVAAIAGFASADTCSCGDTCPFGYRLKVMVRTTTPCGVVVKDPCGDPCGDTAAVYRKPAIRRFMGMVYGTTGEEDGLCGAKGCACNTWEDTAYVALYDYDHQVPVALDAEATELIQLNRVGCGKADNKVEMAYQIGFLCNDAAAGQLTFGGFGLVGIHKDKITVGSVSGYCAGLLPSNAVVDNGPCVDPTALCGSYVWNLCCDTAYSCKTTAAYGKWTLVWDSSLADKVGTNLTAASAKTGWGEAKAVLLADKRECKDVACATSTCGDPSPCACGD